MKKILVPFDFSEQATNAFRFALNIKGEEQIEVHLVHAIELPVLRPAFSFGEEMLQGLKDDLQRKGHEKFEEVIGEYADAEENIVAKIEFGTTAHTILKYIDREEINLVIMGTKGAHGLREVLIGSTTEKIVRAANIPVIAVKDFIEPANIKDIVFPNTLISDADEGLIMKVKELQNILQATIHVVWINTPLNFRKDRLTREDLKHFTRRYMLKNATINIYNDIDEESGIINFAHMIGADMIALGTHGRKGLAHVLNGSIAEDLVNHADLPVWTYSIKNIHH